MILSIKPSPLKTKRYRVQFRYADGTEKSFDFGFKSALRFGQTYLDGASADTRDNYRKRHMGNEVEAKLIQNLVPSPALFSYYLLWGEYRNIEDNKIALNAMFKKG